MTAPQEEIAAVIAVELVRQIDAETNKGQLGWLDVDDVTETGIDGRVDLTKIGEALIAAGWVKPA